MNWKRYWVPAIAALVLIASYWILQRLEPELPAVVGAEHSPDYYMEGFQRITMNAEGKPLRSITAEYMAHFPDTDTHEFSAPYLVLYRDEGRPWHVQSERGWVSASGDVMLLLGRVHIWRNGSSGARAIDIVTEDLRVLPDTDYGETDKPVVISTPTTRTQGIGMRAYMAEDRIQILSDVRTRHTLRTTNEEQ